MNLLVGSLGRLHLTILRYCLGLFLGLALLMPSQGFAKGKADNELVAYVFEPGDTLIALARKYLRKRSDYKAVQRLNRIKDPHQISVGRTVQIPFRLLKFRPSEASLSAFRGDISIASAGQQLAPVKGLDIGEGSQLTTATRSFITLQLEDGSRISMPSNSQIRISRLRQILLTDSIDYEITVDKGRIRSKVAPLDNRSDRHRVRTPVAVSAVRGTDFRTRVDALSGTAFSETVEGEVELASEVGSADTPAVSLPAGTGAAATSTGELAKVELLDPPELIDPAKVQSDAELQFAFAPSGPALGHRINISSDAGFVDIVAEQQSDGNNLALPSLPDGRYFLKAVSLAREGFEGMPVTYGFKRQLSTLGGSASSGDFGYQFKWFGEGSGKRYYRFQLIRDSKSAVPMVDETGLVVQALTLSDLPDGDYFWRVGVTQFSTDTSDRESVQKWTDFEKLTVVN